ncbi:MAG: alpha/beta hydrolase [Chloroflexota bacterium]|nr:alpha/beta hydrolase [Chloroflexota bacterium]
MSTHDYADVNSVRLHYVSEGSGDLILFLHGFPEFWYAWREQLAEFGKDHRAVAVDMRGYNLSEKPSAVEAYQMPELIEDVRALIEHLGYRTCTLVGHDWGGVVAWAVAHRYPDLLDRLVIINAPHGAIFARELRDNPAQQAASQYMLMFRSDEAEAVLSANNYAVLTDAVLGTSSAFTDADRAAYLAAWSQPGALTGGLNYYRAARIGPPTEEETRAAPRPHGASPAPLAVPTLVIWGEADTALLTGNLDGLDAQVANLTIVRIPEGTHWVIHEQPARVDDEIRKFLTT